jgi:hypothetical protein
MARKKENIIPFNARDKQSLPKRELLRRPLQQAPFAAGNLLSHYYVNDFWGLARDFSR